MKFGEFGEIADKHDFPSFFGKLFTFATVPLKKEKS